MSRSGYDRRSRNTDRVVVTEIRGGTNVSSQLFHSKAEEVISYRTEIQGTEVPAATVDPYRDYLLHDAEQNRERQREIQRQLELSGLPGLPRYEVESFNDTGHPFSKVEYSGQTSLRTHHAFYTDTNSTVVSSGGPFIANGARVLTAHRSRMPFQFEGTTQDARATFKYPTFPSGTTSELEDYSRKAIKILAPGRPSINMVRTVGELLAGIPRMPGAALLKSDSVAGVGDEWLNALFGIIPTVDDAISVGNVLKDISVKLHQYRRDAGRIVRRKITFPELSNSEIFNTSELQNGSIRIGSAGYVPGPVFPDSLGRAPGSTVRAFTNPPGRGYHQLFMQEMKTTSFSGAFTYYIPQSPNFLGNFGRYVAELDRVIGLQLDPTTAWQLTPFSWLVDWFVDVKSNLDLIELSYDDNLVVNYGYGMQTWERTVIQKSEVTNTHPDFGTRFVSTRLSALSKRRIRANPYGFITSSSGDWNPYRWSILAALGLTKLR